MFLQKPTYDGAVAAADDEDAGGYGEGNQDLDAVVQHQVAKIVVAGYDKQIILGSEWLALVKCPVSILDGGT